jgi:acyl-CoA thioesterase
LLDIEIDEVTEDSALLSMKVSDKHLNEMDAVQGGAIATLGDTAFAVACNVKEIMRVSETTFVSRSAHIVYTKPALGKTLYAKGKMLSQGRRTGLCEVRIYDENETEVAHFMGDCFKVKG